ncbi:endolytic transglycosylase MltG [Georgenia satyanarayanai]|uniref:endolytic transglycosylase MltG n=1 Tax=Georgenia satyanarayanai TaxID=860221 RepID=UPI001265A178|nr:endolytic transglycosylase MltG [Georgenia satyanarayanai]
MSDLFDQALLADEPEPRSSVERRSARRDRAERKRRRRRRTAVAVVLSLLLVVALGVGGFLVLRPLFDGSDAPVAEDYPGPGSGSVPVVIEEGATGAAMGSTLVEAGVVASQQAFVQAFSANPDAAQIQPGTYELLGQMRAEDAVTALLNPANKSELRITVPEGWRAEQIFERIASVAQIPLEEVEAAAADREAIGLPEQAADNPEGWFAAATYTLEPDADATAILAAMVAQTRTTLESLDVPADQQHDVLTRASIIEHEVNREEDQGKVARVLENRLQNCSDDGLIGMDSTINYGVGRSGGVPERSELDNADNPYNTRIHPGLPPTPIGAPGVAAIEAVLDPPEGDWCYFVTVNLDTGETRFTGDYSEHLQNQELFREWLATNPSDDEG